MKQRRDQQGTDGRASALAVPGRGRVVRYRGFRRRVVGLRGERLRVRVVTVPTLP